MKRLKGTTAILAALVLAVCATESKTAYAASPLPNGTLMVSTFNGLVQEWDTSTTPPTFVGLLDTTKGIGSTAGSIFDVAGNFFVTDFGANAVTKFDPTGALIGNFGAGYNADPESIVLNALGDAFVGQADGSHLLLEFAPTGAPITSFAPSIEDRGTDWISLAADQCTLFYTSENEDVKRFNVCTNTQLGDFNVAKLPSPPPNDQAYQNKIRPNGEVLVADTTEVTRLDASGNQIQHYLASSIEPGNSSPVLFGLVLDPDGKSFWTADASSFDVFKIDIATGTVKTQFNAATSCTMCGIPDAVAGLSLKGQITVSNPPPVCTDATASDPKLWPPNHKFVSESVLGVTDVSGPFTITISSIQQDEPVLQNGSGSGHTCPDGKGVGTSTAMVLSERGGPADGRVYHIGFTATDINGNSCMGNVPVCVPHDQGHGGRCIDEGALFDSTKCP